MTSVRISDQHLTINNTQMEQEKEMMASTVEQDYNPLKDLVAAKGG